MTETQNPEVSVPQPLGSVLVEADYTAFLYNKSHGGETNGFISPTSFVEDY